ncbi:hypothetical protein L1987_18427 [Smallanthus sonchifolius]|uniref:Uncharacterized protein n=1 Tax=Smallanthus sonchifolius TaxID=185202 RepID=A0ACB9J0R0_9ASTR|nr:hypothetical protein L1987_18427 [Smallanthus sonchifolius]
MLLENHQKLLKRTSEASKETSETMISSKHAQDLFKENSENAYFHLGKECAVHTILFANMVLTHEKEQEQRLTRLSLVMPAQNLSNVFNIQRGRYSQENTEKSKGQRTMPPTWKNLDCL